VVRAYVRAVDWVNAEPDSAAELAAPLIGVKAAVVAAAIRANPPRVDGVRNLEVMRRILAFMQTLGYVRDVPDGFVDLRFMEPALVDAAG
jgi:ABC-type nitrate/sulfonate/bicarbonate transport system substrate-binding protein